MFPQWAIANIFYNNVAISDKSKNIYVSHMINLRGILGG